MSTLFSKGDLISHIEERNQWKHNGNWAVLSDEQMRKIWPFSLLNDEQMSNKVEVKHQPGNHVVLLKQIHSGKLT